MSERAEKIVDRCPSCGARSLFIGKGGYLTCGVIGCREPAVGAAMESMKAALESERARSAMLREALYDDYADAGNVPSNDDNGLSGWLAQRRALLAATEADVQAWLAARDAKVRREAKSVTEEK